MQSKPDVSMAKRIADYILELYNQLERGGKIKARQRYPFSKILLPGDTALYRLRWQVVLMPKKGSEFFGAGYEMGA